MMRGRILPLSKGGIAAFAINAVVHVRRLKRETDPLRRRIVTSEHCFLSVYWTWTSAPLDGMIRSF